MTLQVKLAKKTKKAWLQTVLNDFDSFILDHADCERKAAKTALALVAKYPHYSKVAEQLVNISITELGQFQQLIMIIHKKGLQLQKEMPHDLYAKQLSWLSRSGRKERFIDKVIISALIHLRSSERLGLLAESLDIPELKTLYKTFAETDEKHANIYLNLLEGTHKSGELKSRIKHLVNEEANIIEQLDVKATLY